MRGRRRTYTFNVRLTLEADRETHQAQSADVRRELLRTLNGGITLVREPLRSVNRKADKAETWTIVSAE
jgi:hypothetical protein